MKETKLKVQEAMQNDVGRGIVRIDSETRDALGLTSGDIVKVNGKTETAGVVWQCYPQDEGLKIIRMDGLIRQNAGVGIGDYVTIEKTDPKPASKITLAPTQPVRFSPGFESYVQKRLIGRPLAKGDRVLVGVFGTSLVMVATKTTPKGFVQITQETQIELKTEPIKEVIGVPQVTYEDIGGLKDEVHKVREMIEIPLKHPELFERLGIEPPKGVLLHGPPGTGKTLLAKAVANESDANFISIQGPEIVSKFVGEAEERLRQIFKQAEENAPTIIFIDEIDAIAPKRGEVHGEVEKRIVAQLLASMDGLQARGNVVVIAATNRVNAIDEALRRPGRFDREIELGVPDRKGRKEILQIHTRNMPLDGVDLDRMADITHGYVGADVQSLAKEAAMKTLRRLIPKMNLEGEDGIPAEVLENLRVTKDDFMNAFREVQPSALREVLVEVPNVRWGDVGGLDTVKKQLREAIEWPIKDPKMFTRLGIRPPKGLFLFGPPGSGKTLLAKAVATESESNFIVVKGPELLSKWVGESLPFDEEVLVIRDGLLEREEIGKLVESSGGDGVMAPTVTDSLKAKNSKIIDFIRHPAPPYVDVLVTETGRKVRVTGGHSVFVKGGNGLEEVVAEEVKPGETRIAVPMKLKPVGSVVEINLLDRLQKTKYALFVKNGQKLVKKAIEKVGAAEAARILGKERKNIHAYAKRAALPVDSFVMLMDHAAIKYNPRDLVISSRYRKHELPAVLKMDKDFGTFLGLWVAEGSYLSYGVRISTSDSELPVVKRLCKKLFKNLTIYEKPDSRGRDVIISSLPLKAVLEEVLKLRGGAKNKRMPTEVLSAPLPAVSGFLRGYFGGDGYFSGKYVEASTVSQDLANDVMIALQYFGIVARCREKKEWTGSTSYRVRFLWTGFLKKFAEEIGFLYGSKNKLLNAYLKNIKLKRVLQAPSQHMDGDVYWDLVVEKTRELYEHPYVYDIGVNPTHRFIAGFGGVLVHNSERGVREIFRKARLAAPVVILFDEIDALAPKRGMHSGSVVTETVVNQLLTELDGIEELKDVVILATSNRPDIVDPSLLRPGRFDRMIFVPAPDEESRLAVFEVHTKKMPLAKDVKLKELSEATQGFSGADIEGVCREAAMNALRRDKKSKEVTKKDFAGALKAARPSIQEEDLKRYRGFMEEHKSSIDTASYIG